MTTTHTAFVSQLNGNDGTGTLQNPSLKYQTLAAVAAAITGSGSASDQWVIQFDPGEYGTGNFSSLNVIFLGTEASIINANLTTNANSILRFQGMSHIISGSSISWTLGTIYYSGTLLGCANTESTLLTVAGAAVTIENSRTADPQLLTPASSFIYLLSLTSGSLAIHDSVFSASFTTLAVARGINAVGGIFNMRDSQLKLNGSAAAGSTYTLINGQGSLVATLENVRFIAYGEVTGTVIVFNANTGASIMSSKVQLMNYYNIFQSVFQSDSANVTIQDFTATGVPEFAVANTGYATGSAFDNRGNLHLSGGIFDNIQLVQASVNSNGYPMCYTVKYDDSTLIVDTTCGPINIIIPRFNSNTTGKRFRVAYVSKCGFPIMITNMGGRLMSANYCSQAGCFVNIMPLYAEFQGYGPDFYQIGGNFILPDFASC